MSNLLVQKKPLNESYRSKVSYERMLNEAFFKIFSDYFNMLSQDKKLADKHNMKDISFYRMKTFLSTIDLSNYWGETNILFEYEKLLMVFSFDKYKQNNEVKHTLVISSKQQTYIEGRVIFDLILNNALSVSNLRGSYIEMPRDHFSWKRKDLEKRGFEDIFLPSTTMEDLHLYINVFEKKNILMKYLMVGNPGTGKTESTLIIANELRNKGVTIIKTPVCEFLKEKLEFAEALAPSVILFDDLDLSIGSRSKGGYSPKELQTFLDAMDGTEKISKQVGIIATTNSSQLLDLAAQRPGRFEKILVFDILSKKNILDIIFKSLKYNFNILKDNADKNIIDLFYNRDIIRVFYNAKVTGAHVYNSIKVLKLKMEMMNEAVDLKWVIKEIDQDLTIADKIRNTDHLKNKLEGKKTLGFGFGDNGEDEEDLFDPIGSDKEEKVTEAEVVRKDSQRGS